MPFKLIPPGQRKGNPYYLARASFGGRDIEVSTKTRDLTVARRFAKELERKIQESGLPRPGETLSFAHAAELYIEYRDPAKADRARIARLLAALGRKMVADIRQVDLVQAANALCGGKSSATKNREVLRPAASILHYAARNGFCAWLRIELFREARPKTRAVSLDTAMTLLEAVEPGPRRLFLLWSFRQGTRISDTLGVAWDRIDLPRQTVRLRISKTDTWMEAPLHPEVFEELAAIPEAERIGRLFPWTQKTGVYRWLRPLTRELELKFTPHMARHSLGTWLNESGAGLRTIMAALGHLDPKSSIRYQTADVEIVRAAAQKLPGMLRGISGQNPKKAQNA
jgi:integrase